MTFIEALQAFWTWLSSNWTAIALFLFNVEESRVDEQKAKTEEANLELELEKNKESVINKHLGESDIDIIREVIGGSEPQPGRPKKDS